MLRSLLSCLLLCTGLCAQAAPDAAPPAGIAASGIRGVDIMQVRPDASSESGYEKQGNAERARVQPGNNAPVWRQVNSGVAGISSLPRSEAPEAGVLIQPFVQYPGSRLTNAGQAWREVRNNWIIPYGGSLLLIVLGAIALFHWRVGPMKVDDTPTGRKVERFTPFERAAHWANALAFCVLALSGVVMAFGQFILQPVIGVTLFGWLAYVLKNAHNFAGPLFAVSLLVVIVTFLRDNLPAKGDLNWLLKGGGIFSGHEVKSGRFNAGEKVVFWGGVLALGLVVVASGLVMDKLVPGVNYERSTMQLTHMVHSVANLLMLVMIMGHVYMGTIGTPGSLEGMQTGYVEEAWAREHHALWLEDIKSGRIPAQRSAPGASRDALQV